MLNEKSTEKLVILQVDMEYGENKPKKGSD